MRRCDAVFGFNTKQWWAYDGDMHVLIDPPFSILKEIESCSDSLDEQEDYFNEILNQNPDWLNDLEFTYDGDLEI